MADQIPEEIMREALAVAGHVYDPTSSKGAHDYVTSLVARALMARDKRAAEIARQEIDTYHGGVSAIDVRFSITRGPRWRDGAAIATAILTYEGSPAKEERS